MKQMNSSLRLTGLNLGYLLNFGEGLLKDGITRCVNRLEEDVPPENAAQRRGEVENQTSPPQRLSGSAAQRETLLNKTLNLL